MQAKAVVFPAPNEVEFRSVDCPEPGPGDVVVRVTHSCISNGTEGSFRLHDKGADGPGDGVDGPGGGMGGSLRGFSLSS